MKIDERISEILEDFAKEVNKEILERNFTKINEDEYTIKIEVLGETVEIWNVENLDTCLYRVLLSSHESLHVKNGRFEKPKTCRKILREYSEDEKNKINNDIEKEIKKLQNKKIKIAKD